MELLALSGAMEQAMTVFLPHKISGFRAIAEYGQVLPPLHGMYYFLTHTCQQH